MTTAPIFNFTDTWNDAGVTYSAIKVSITDTASAAGSKLIDFEVGGVSQSSIGKDGGIICKGLTSSLNIDLQGNRLVMDADNDTYLEASTDDRLDFVVGGTLVARFDANAVDTFQLDGVGFSPTGAVVGQSLGYPNSPTTLEPYTPAGGGDLLAAANETVTGDYNFTSALQWNGVQVVSLSASQTLSNKTLDDPAFANQDIFDSSSLITQYNYEKVAFTQWDEPSPQSVTSITRSGTTATVTLTAHGLRVGDRVIISGADQSEYNLLETLVTSVPTADTFTYEVSGAPATPATGTITAVYSYSYEGFSLDIGDYGPVQFGAHGVPTAVSGKINIPSRAGFNAHGAGIAGYARTASTDTGAVAVFGEAKLAANTTTAWGLNTRTKDLGFAAAKVWGYEADINLENINSTAIGVEAIGASTVEPASGTFAFNAGPLGVFASPKVRWQVAYKSADGGAVTGLSLGAQQDTASSAAQGIEAYYYNSGGSRAQSYGLAGDSGGNVLFVAETNDTLLDIGAKTGGVSQKNVRAYQNKTGLNFNGIPAHAAHVGGDMVFTPSTSVTLGNNGEAGFQSASNGRFDILRRGSDGVTRLAPLVLFQSSDVQAAGVAKATTNGDVTTARQWAVTQDGNPAFAFSQGYYLDSANVTFAGVLQAVSSGTPVPVYINPEGGNVSVGKVGAAYQLDVDGDTNIATGAVYRVAGTQVVGARVINADIADPPALTAQALTDNSGGTASQTIAAISNALTGVDGTGSNAAPLAGVNSELGNIRNAIASIADDLNKVRADLEEVRAHGGVASNTVIRSHGFGAVS